MLHKPGSTGLRFLTMAAALAVMQAGWAQTIVQTDSDIPYTETDEGRLALLILLQHPQPALLGPDALKIQRDRPRDSYQDSWGRSAIWRMIGQTHEGRRRVVAVGTDLSATDVFDELVVRFDYVGATVDSLAQYGTGSNWSIRDIKRTNFIGGKSGKWLDGRLVRQMFSRSDADGVMSVRYTYFMSPNLRQVRLVAELRLHLRAARDPRKYYLAIKRRYEYLAPPHKHGLRTWQDGEKAAFERTIERDYEDRTEQYPHNKAAYRDDLNDIQAELRRDPDYILLPDGMLEAWSQDELHGALAFAAERMATMIRTDLSDVPADELVEGRMLTITGLQADGDLKRIRAREFFRDGANTVYQTGGGNLYSIPTPE